MGRHLGPIRAHGEIGREKSTISRSSLSRHRQQLISPFLPFSEKNTQIGSVSNTQSPSARFSASISSFSDLLIHNRYVSISEKSPKTVGISCSEWPPSRITYCSCCLSDLFVMRCSGLRCVAAGSDGFGCSGRRKRVAEACVSDSCIYENRKRKCVARVRAAVVELSYVGAPMVSKSTGCPCDFVQLEPGRAYTIGRSRRLCDFVLDLPKVSRQHCRIFLDSSSRRIFIVDGGCVGNSLTGNGKEDEKDEEEERDSGSLNGVSVNGVRCKIGKPAELFVGDEVSLVCTGDRCDSHCKVGFVIRKVLFLEEEGGIFPSQGDSGTVRSSFSPRRISCSSSSSSKRIFASRSCVGSSRSCTAISRATTLLGQCRHILRSADPISCILRCPIYFGTFFEAPLACNKFSSSKVDRTLRKHVSPIAKTVSRNIVPVHRQELPPHFSSNIDGNKQACFQAECSPQRANASLENITGDENSSLINSASVVAVPSPREASVKKDRDNSCKPSLEGNFCLNRLVSAEQGSVGHRSDVSLPELLNPVQSILRIFIATFTSDIEWFLSYCQIPRHMPVTIACHNTQRCWSSRPDERTLLPYPEFPNVEVVFPPFPESIAFGTDRKKQGIACHHPKLIVVQREDRIRVVISSANLVPKQWISITNTVWWQDFPRRKAPDYMSLFTRITDDESSNQRSSSDFAAQLAGFMACLVIDDPRQAHWITELTKYDFHGASGYLVTSVPGIHSYRFQQESALTGFSMDGRDKLLATVQASVVGLSYFFRTASDSNGAALKKLATFLLNSHVSESGMLEVVLRRNTNVAADPNAVSVLARDPNNITAGDCVQFGFLPRIVVKWVSPLWDGGFFRFSGYISPKEVLAAARGEDNKKVQLILHVFQGPSFPDLPKMINHDCMIALSSLIASMDRCIGLSRLHEGIFMWKLEKLLEHGLGYFPFDDNPNNKVVGQYSWPETLETDFVYAASSIGSSLSPQFLAAFSAAAGKKSSTLSESEESDPEWGRWTASQELKNPSMRIIFPTIQRVKNAVNGISPSRQILCFAERTWQRVKAAGILHDAVPYPRHRIGHPMHIKVARRRFKSRKGASSSGWVYSGSHNFSAAAWGRPILSRSGSKAMKLHVCNYELGIVFVAPPGGRTSATRNSIADLDDIELPFVMPAPKYGASDRPATKEAMREAVAKLNILESEPSEVPLTEEVEEIPAEEELVEPVECVIENAEDNGYADMLWSQVDSSSTS